MYTVKMLHLLSIMQVFVFKLLLTFLHSAIPLSRQKLGERLTALLKLVFSAAFNLPPPSTSTPPVAPVARKTWCTGGERQQAGFLDHPDADEQWAVYISNVCKKRKHLFIHINIHISACIRLKSYKILLTGYQEKNGINETPYPAPFCEFSCSDSSIGNKWSGGTWQIRRIEAAPPLPGAQLFLR